MEWYWMHQCVNDLNDGCLAIKQPTIMDKSCWDTWKLPTFFLGVNSPLYPRERYPSCPPFSMLKTNKHPQSILLHCLGGKGVTTEEKIVFIQIQNTIVSSKTLVLVNCLNTFVHDCSLITKRSCSSMVTEHPTGITEVVGSIPSWNSENLFSISFTCCQATIT